MRLTTAILAASLFMYVGVRNGTGENIKPCGTQLKVNYYKKGRLIGDRVYSTGSYWVSGLMLIDDDFTGCDSVSIKIYAPPVFNPKRKSFKPSPSPLPDTTKPRDTLYVPLFERSDTTNAIIVYLAPDGNVKHLTGKVIVVGIKLQTGQWADPSRLQYNFFDNKGARMKVHIVDWYAIAAPKKESVKIEQPKGGKP